MISIPVEPPITEYLHAKAARQGIPLSGTFELAPLCNMNCRMCYVRMSREQQEQATRDYTALFHQVVEATRDADLLVLDEMISACNHGVVPLEEVVCFLKTKPEKLEVVLTGRNPPQSLLELADYVTEMKKIKHPFDQGIPARKGIEY